MEEFVGTKIVAVPFVIYADSLSDAGLKAQVMIDSSETLLSVKSRTRYEVDLQNGKRLR